MPAGFNPWQRKLPIENARHEDLFSEGNNERRMWNRRLLSTGAGPSADKPLESYRQSLQVQLETT
jgi:hypothetical protein